MRLILINMGAFSFDNLQKLKGRIKIYKSKNINANYKVATGISEDEIMKFSKNHNVDLIIMAKRRKISGIKGFLQLGSVSRKILEAAKRPVLIVEP